MSATVRRPFAEAVRTRTLANGARIFVLENRFNPTFALSGSMRAGRLYAPPDRRLIASLTAGELMKGTARRSKLELAEDLEARAASLSFSSDASDPVGVDIGGSALSRDADLLLDALVEVLCMPAFPAEELDKEKKRLVGSIRQQQEQTSVRAYEAAMRRIYPVGHPLYRHDGQERIAKVEALDRAKKAGKVRYVGFTGHKDPGVHLDMLKRGYKFDAVQMPLNPFDATFRDLLVDKAANDTAANFIRDKIRSIEHEQQGR